MIEGTFRKDRTVSTWTLVVSGAVVVGGALALVILLRGDVTVAMVVAAVAILVAAVAIRQVRRRLVLVRFDNGHLSIDQTQVAEAPFTVGIVQIAGSRRRPSVYTLRLVAGKIALDERIPTGTVPPNLPPLDGDTETVYTSTTPYPGTLWSIVRQLDLPPNPLVRTLIDADERIQQAINHYDYDSAVRLLTREINRAPTAAAYHNRALVQDDNTAINDFTEAIRLDDRFFAAYKGRALAYSRLKRWREVLADCEMALSLREDDALYNLQGVAYYALGEAEQAIASYDRAVTHNPDNAQAYNNRAVVRQHTGDRAGAKADYAQALRLDPTLTTAREGLARLND